MPEHVNKTHTPDPAFDDTVALVDRVAEADRGEPDTGFEARLIASARPGVAGKIGAGAHGWGPLARSWWMLPVAAALAFGVFWIRTETTPAPGTDPSLNRVAATMTLASVEADLDDFLFVDELTDAQSVFASDSDADGSYDELALPSETADALLFDLLAAYGESL